MKHGELKQKIELLYLSWSNDFLTVARFAEYYGIEDHNKARRIINIGRKINHKR